MVLVAQYGGMDDEHDPRWSGRPAPVVPDQLDQAQQEKQRLAFEDEQERKRLQFQEEQEA